MVEFGHTKEDKNLQIFNCSIAYDTNNSEPLFYEQYPGSIVNYRYFYLYYSDQKACAEKEQIEGKIERMANILRRTLQS